MEVASTLVYAALCVVLVLRIASGFIRGTPGPVAITAAVVGAYLAADLASGLVHYLADTIGSSRTPVLGRKFILPFRVHHESPREITEHDFFETNGDSCFFASVVLAVALATLAPELGHAEAALGLFALTLAALIVMTTQFHKWAHAKKVPPGVRALQRLGVILRPDAHARHHEPPFDRSYCITSGVLNPLIDALGVFRAPTERSLESRRT